MRDLRWKTLASEYLFKETWFTVRKDTCLKPEGKVVNPYFVFEFPEWATAFPITEEGKIIMVRQYRHALGEVCIELPGGCVDPEDPSHEDGIRRELLEETGYVFSEVHYLGKVSANPSTNNNLMHMYIAKGGKKIKEQELDDNEEIEVIELTVEEVLQLVEERAILQSMHMTTIFYALRYLEILRYYNKDTRERG